jgi:hypothetical protein
MQRTRLNPPYKAYAVSADGNRTPLDAHSIVVELGAGAELELDLAPHPNFDGELSIRAGPEQSLEHMQQTGSYPSLVVRAGAANALLVSVEHHHIECDREDQESNTA